MPIDDKFYDGQYRQLSANPDAALDHSWYKPFLKYARSRVETGVRIIREEEKIFDNVIELGCGSGELVRSCPKFFHRYTGYDISSYNLQSFERSLTGEMQQEVTLKQYDLNNPLPEKDESFDLIISFSTIEYLFDPVHFIRELYRIARPGCLILLHTLNLAFFPRRLQLLFGKLPTFSSASGWQGGVLHDFTYPALRNLLREHGMAIQKFSCSGLLPPLRRWWPNLLCGDLVFVCRK